MSDPNTATIHWISADSELPDDGETVLAVDCADNIAVMYHSAGTWRLWEGDKKNLYSTVITHWAELPSLPGILLEPDAVRRVLEAGLPHDNTHDPR